MTTLHDRLADLAEDAPPGGPVPHLWSAGVRRHRRVRAVSVLATIVLLVGAVGVTAGLLAPADRSPSPAQVPFGELHLPRTAYPPSPWAAGTDDSGVPGRLAYVSIAERWSPDGITGHQAGMQPFGVSAVDGSAVFLDLPGLGPDDLCCGGVALSPDGTKVGYVRTRGFNDDKILGFAVYDALTGRTRMLDDPRNPVIVGMDYQDIWFSGDSRHLETNYSLTGSNRSRQDSLVVWDVDTGASQVAEPAGHYWRPVHGSAPSGIVWSRARETFTYHPETSDTTSVRTDVQVVEASYGPDGRAFAMIGNGPKREADLRLLVGPAHDDLRQVSLDIDADQLLGWRDAQHVVVRQLPTGEAVVVDTVTGAATDLRVDVTGRQMMLPAYAADLWANDLVDGVQPPTVHDPRLPWWVAGGVALVALIGLRLWRRRVRA